MTTFNSINFSPNDACGFCNQLYSIVASCCYIFNSTPQLRNIIFLGQFLKQVKSDSFCNIGNIIDLKVTNLFLKKYNIILVDLFDYTFKITSIKYGVNNNYIFDLLHSINHNDFIQGKIKYLNDYKGDPLLFYTRQYGIPFNKKQQKTLYLQYTINNILFDEQYLVSSEGFILREKGINLDFKNLPPITCQVHNDGSLIFYDILRNITFNTVYTSLAKKYLSSLSANDTKINCIHLRLEKDAMEHWGRPSVENYKQLVENKYIQLIQKYITDKSVLTIVLAHDYDNDVIKYLEKHNYNYKITPKYYNEREISAIVDLEIGQACNNVCLCVFESTFSFALCTRVHDKTHFNNFLICLTDLDTKNEIVFVNKNK
jgi:hypothetical protein